MQNGFVGLKKLGDVVEIETSVRPGVLTPRSLDIVKGTLKSMSMTMAEKVVALKSWMEQNPLRKKREEIKASKDHAAVLMGISVSTIKTWESGAHMPSNPSMKRIARFMELPVSEARAQWNAWWNSRPGQSELTDERLVTKKGGRPY